jgi:DNA polymerase-1
MALRGDSIDNIPGAPGIGDKGSVEIIRRFGTVENALDHAEEIERKTYRESLLHNRDVVMLSKDLATIDTNVPVKLDLALMKAQPPDFELARTLFNELEFTTLLKEILPATELDETEYQELQSAAQWKQLLTKAKKTGLALAFEAVTRTKAEAQPAEKETEAEDAELPAPQSGDLFAATPPPVEQSCSRRIGLSVESGKAYLADLGGPIGKEIQTALADDSIRKSIHDFKAALHACAEARVELAGLEHDTMLYSYLLDPTFTSHSLANVALRRFNLKISDSPAQWADLTGRLASKLRKEVEEAGFISLYDEIDLPLAPVLARMEAAGVKIDTAALAAMSERLERECNAKTREIHQAAGEKFNVNAPRQLGEVLFNKMNLPKPVKYGRGKTISTAVDVLEELALEHPIARMVLDYRQLSKLKSTYVDTLPALIDPRTGRVHTTFQQAATSTGRLSSINPNLQNIPIRTELGREIRAAFVADPGNLLISADYSQIELRLLAHFSQDRLLTEAFRNGDDIHSLTAEQVFGSVNAENRRRAKVINFGIAYGMSPFGLSQELGIETKEAKAYIDAYFEKYSGVRAFIDRTLEQCRRDGFVKTLFGRTRPIPDILSKNPNMRGFAERTAVNTPLQGTAADLIKLAMIRIDAAIRERGLKTRMTLQVHDELVFEVPESELDEVHALVEDKMQNVHPLSVPILVDIGVGKNWRDAK